MTPKEKAKELVEKMGKSVNTITNIPLKKCALIAVEELIECSKSYDNYNATWASQISYWEQVKHEIEQL